jgi:predicted transcriptional regulator
MDIENLLPKEATVEKIGLSLQGIFDDIRGLSKEELLSHPREYVLNDKIDVKILKEIRKLPVECSNAGYGWFRTQLG